MRINLVRLLGLIDAITDSQMLKGGYLVFDDCVKNLLAAIWYQALKDFKRDQKNDYLRDWLINEGREICAPHFSRRNAEEILNEYLSD